MKTNDKSKWNHAVKEVQVNIIKLDVWEAVPWLEVRKDAKALAFIWETKKKSKLACHG